MLDTALFSLLDYMFRQWISTCIYCYKASAFATTYIFNGFSQKAHAEIITFTVTIKIKAISRTKASQLNIELCTKYLKIVPLNHINHSR